MLSRPETSSNGLRRTPYTLARRNTVPGVYRAAMPNGKFISLMRVMFTDFCKMDCFYCPNSHWVPRKRYAFKADELARSFIELRQRHAVEGLFLSSGIAGDGSKTTQKLVKTVEIIRKKYGFKGYIHMKVMPGTERQYVEAAHRLGTRLSVNVEAPSAEALRKLSTMKDFDRDIMDPIRWIDELTQRETGGAVGQATQLVVGAADESDVDIFKRMDHLYSDLKLKRVYYSPFRPVRYTPLEEHPSTPIIREHRLYQMDWLKRIYKFSNEEMGLAFDGDGFLSHESDPKTTIALERADSFPVDVNEASKETLLRVPGVGPVSAERILRNRRQHRIDTWRDLQSMGVVRKRAWAFLAFPGQRPVRAKQLRMSFEETKAATGLRDDKAMGHGGATAPCGEVRSCVGCPMFGAPGHPGSVN